MTMIRVSNGGVNVQSFCASPFEVSAVNDALNTWGNLLLRKMPAPGLVRQVTFSQWADEIAALEGTAASARAVMIVQILHRLHDLNFARDERMRAGMGYLKQQALVKYGERRLSVWDWEEFAKACDVPKNDAHLYFKSMMEHGFFEFIKLNDGSGYFKMMR